MTSQPERRPAEVDESAESEIIIAADGRVFAFGITRGVAAVLATIPTADERMKSLLGRLSGIMNPSEPLNIKEPP
jgi:hypothetical protein